MVLSLRCRFGLLLAALVGGPQAGAQVRLPIAERPQFTANSCQSYALAFVLGTFPGTPVPVATAKQLRELERTIYTRLGKDRGSAESWQRVTQEITNGQIELVLERVPTLSAFSTRVGELTGVSAAEKSGAAFAIAAGKQPLLTSVIRIGETSYADGHIVTVFGVSSEPLEPPPLVLLNPAVKVKDAYRLACEIDDVANDERWSASAALVRTYVLKNYGQHFGLAPV